jgi:hypothetical protein
MDRRFTLNIMNLLTPFRAIKDVRKIKPGKFDQIIEELKCGNDENMGLLYKHSGSTYPGIQLHHREFAPSASRLYIVCSNR